MFIYTKYNTIINTDNVTCFERVRKYTGSVIRKDEAYFEIVAHVTSNLENEARILIGEYSTEEEVQETLDRIFNWIGAGLNFMDLRKEGDK